MKQTIKLRAQYSFPGQHNNREDTSNSFCKELQCSLLDDGFHTHNKSASLSLTHTHTITLYTIQRQQHLKLWPSYIYNTITFGLFRSITSIGILEHIYKNVPISSSHRIQPNIFPIHPVRFPPPDSSDPTRPFPIGRDLFLVCNEEPMSGSKHTWNED